MYSWLALLLFSMISYYFFSVYLAYAIFGILIYVVLKDLYIIGETKFNSGTIKKSQIYYKKVTGSYKENYLHFKTTHDILTKFKLIEKYEYYSFGFYLDDPKKVKESNCRSCIGICFTPSDPKMEINKELVDYLKQDKWVSSEFPASPAIVSRFPCPHNLMIPLIILRFFKDYERSLVDKDFIQKMRFDPSKIPGIIEIYKPKMVEFYVPIGNQEKFNLWEIEN